MLIFASGSCFQTDPAGSGNKNEIIMTNKQFQNLKKGDMVMFQQAGGNKINGHVVAVADVWADGNIVVPRPDYNNELCVFPYRSLKLVK